MPVREISVIEAVEAMVNEVVEYLVQLIMKGLKEKNPRKE